MFCDSLAHLYGVLLHPEDHHYVHQSLPLVQLHIFTHYSRIQLLMIRNANETVQVKLQHCDIYHFLNSAYSLLTYFYK
jgi:hypothetical protein